MTETTQSDTESLKNNISLLDYARSRNLDLKKAGNDWKCLCPLHSEKTPSFVITESKNLWNCFGCGKGGDVFSLVMELDRVEFKEALLTLREYAGDIGDLSSSTKESRNETEKPERINLTNPKIQKHIEWVLEHYRRSLLESHEAQEYLKKRDVFDSTILEKVNAGFCSGDLEKYMPPDNSPMKAELCKALQEIGILTENNQERFKNCLVFALLDEIGNVVQISGRRIMDNKKETRHLVLPHPLRGFINPDALTARHNEVILCEGVFDMLSFMKAGFPNVSCTHGTNGLGNERLNNLLSSPASKFKIAFDGDSAGDAGALLLAGKLVTKQCYRVNFPKDTDTNSYLLKEGTNFKKSIESLLVKSVLLNGKINGELNNSFDHLIANTDIEAKVNNSVVDICIGDRYWKAEDFGKKISHGSIPVSLSVSLDRRFYTDSLDMYSARDRERFIKGAVKKLEQDYTLIDSDMDLVFLKLRGLKDKIINDQLETTKNPLDEMTAEQMERAYALGRDPNIIERLGEHFKKCGLVGEESNALLIYFLIISRLLEKPLHVKVISSPGAGKSMLLNMALGFCPPETLLRFTSLSANALFYMKDIRQKVLLIEEDVGIDARFPLKMLQSDGQLTRGTVIKDPATGKHVMLEVDTKGPASTLTSSTDTVIRDEEEMRVIITTIDESKPQTEAILDMQRLMQTPAGRRLKIESQEIIQTHHDFQRLLQAHPVFNPYAKKLKFMTDKHRSRRDFPKLLTMIMSVTLLFQMQRKLETWQYKGYTEKLLLSTLEDNLLGVRIARHIMGQTLDEMAPHTRKFLIQFYEWVQATHEKKKLLKDKCLPLTRNLMDQTGLSRAQVNRHLDELRHMDYVHRKNDTKGRPIHELLYDGQGNDGELFISGIPGEKELKKILVEWGKELRKKAKPGHPWWDPELIDS